MLCEFLFMLKANYLQTYCYIYTIQFILKHINSFLMAEYIKMPKGQSLKHDTMREDCCNGAWTCNNIQTVCSVYCAGYSALCEVCRVQCTLCSVQCTVYSALCVLCKVRCIVGGLCSVQCNVCSVQCAVLTIGR